MNKKQTELDIKKYKRHLVTYNGYNLKSWKQKHS